MVFIGRGLFALRHVWPGPCDLTECLSKSKRDHGWSEGMVLSAPDSARTVYERVKRSAHASVTGAFHKLSFQAMNTLCRVNFNTPNPALARDFQAEVLRWVSGFEAHYSRFIDDSLIGRINLAAGLH